MFNPEYAQEYKSALERLNEASKAATEKLDIKPIQESGAVHMITDEEAKLIEEEFEAQKHYREVSDKYFGRSE